MNVQYATPHVLVLAAGSSASASQHNRCDALLDIVRDAVVEKDSGGVVVAQGDDTYASASELRAEIGAEYTLCRLEELAKSEPSVRALTDGVALQVDSRNGKIDKIWNGEQLALTYCVDSSLGVHLNDVRVAAEEAGRAWEDGAGGEAYVNFIDVGDANGSCNDKPLFIVRAATTRSYFARAFYPRFPRSKRELRISSVAFEQQRPSLQGLIAHEFGHILGFRHEALYAAGSTGSWCVPSDRHFRLLTPDPDPESVMIFPSCEGNTDHDLKMSAGDRIGVRLLYGSGAAKPR